MKKVTINAIETSNENLIKNGLTLVKYNKEGLIEELKTRNGNEWSNKLVKEEVPKTLYPDLSVTFIDYTGELIAEYTLEEVLAMEESDLPVPPEHEKLIFLEWNSTLDEMKEFIREYETGFDVGAFYDTYSGNAILKVWITSTSPDKEFMLPYYCDSSMNHIDYGDGTEIAVGNVRHIYEKPGVYFIEFLRQGAKWWAESFLYQFEFYGGSKIDAVDIYPTFSKLKSSLYPPKIAFSKNWAMPRESNIKVPFSGCVSAPRYNTVAHLPVIPCSSGVTYIHPVNPTYLIPKVSSEWANISNGNNNIIAKTFIMFGTSPCAYPCALVKNIINKGSIVGSTFSLGCFRFILDVRKNKYGNSYNSNITYLTCKEFIFKHLVDDYNLGGSCIILESDSVEFKTPLLFSSFSGLYIKGQKYVKFDVNGINYGPPFVVSLGAAPGAIVITRMHDDSSNDLYGGGSFSLYGKQNFFIFDRDCSAIKVFGYDLEWVHSEKPTSIIIPQQIVKVLPFILMQALQKYITGIKIYVPDNLIKAYKAAPNWCLIAECFHPISEIKDKEVLSMCECKPIYDYVI